MLGDKTFEQCAGFLRVMEGDNPLDRSSVHPESYSLIEKILDRTKTGIRELIGNTASLGNIEPADFVDERFGEMTVRDIIEELKKPGRDPRPEFKTAEFKEGVEKVSDLKPGMSLEGVVTNVANFGAFVDIGVHQDGLVHISQLADKFVKDPRDVVKPGDVVKVTVLETDMQRKRISLTMKSGEAHARKPEKQTSEKSSANPRGKPKKKTDSAAKPPREKQGSQSGMTAMAEAFKRAKSK
jgi:uncharacterized protein